MPEFKDRLKAVRKSHKATQKQVALAVGVSERNYQDWEYGTFNPTLSALVALADFFDVSIDYLCGRTDNPEVNR